MEVRPSPQFAHDYKNLPPLLRKRTDEKLKLLLENPRHPSLELKKMKGFPDIWEARVTKKGLRLESRANHETRDSQ